MSATGDHTTTSQAVAIHNRAGAAENTSPLLEEGEREKTKSQHVDCNMTETFYFEARL